MRGSAQDRLSPLPRPEEPWGGAQRQDDPTIIVRSDSGEERIVALMSVLVLSRPSAFQPRRAQFQGSRADRMGGCPPVVPHTVLPRRKMIKLI